MKFVSVVGARPQFIKAGPLSSELRKRHHEILLHTGQHYDYGLSRVFFEELDLPEPDYNLGIGSGSQAAQTGAMLPAIERVLVSERPDVVIVYGDTNSTLAGALAAAKLHLPVAHVEAGLRSFNRAMPEEVNRVITDHLSTCLFAPSEAAVENLVREGIGAGVHMVGDIMLDALRRYVPRAAERSDVHERLGVIPHSYYVATVHRAENTDDPARLRGIMAGLDQVQAPVVMPIHPRTRHRLEKLEIRPGRQIRLVEPLGYLDHLCLQKSALRILTDSGGMQKEAYYLKVPCITLRDETEWPETVDTGWNVLVGSNPERIYQAVHANLAVDLPHPPLYGDGLAAQRISDILGLNSQSPRSRR